MPVGVDLRTWVRHQELEGQSGVGEETREDHVQTLLIQ